MYRCLTPWLLVIPLGTIGVLGGHEIAYEATRTAHDELHGYMAHLPQVALLLSLLSLVGASFVERGKRLALWPFPTVVLVGFIAQEHLERIAHTGSVPFLLDKPFFLVGLVVQSVLAVAAWLVARLLVRVVGRAPARRATCFARADPVRRLVDVVLADATPLGTAGARSPPLGR